MNFFDLKVKEFLDKIDSAAPTPGGGTVSAAAIAFGIGLLRMVAHITLLKKKFRELPEPAREDYLKRLARLEEIKNVAILLADRDSLAFEKIMSAFRLPKETDEEKARREEAITIATMEATEVPLKTARAGLSALETAMPMFFHATKSALSDFSVGTLLVAAGIEGAVMNVKTNLVSFPDQEFKEETLREAESILSRAREMAADVAGKLEHVFDK